MQQQWGHYQNSGKREDGRENKKRGRKKQQARSTKQRVLPCPNGAFVGGQYHRRDPSKVIDLLGFSDGLSHLCGLASGPLFAFLLPVAPCLRFHLQELCSQRVIEENAGPRKKLRTHSSAGTRGDKPRLYALLLSSDSSNRRMQSNQLYNALYSIYIRVFRYISV